MNLAPLQHARSDSHERFHALYAAHHDVLRRIARMLCGDRTWPMTCCRTPGCGPGARLVPERDRGGQGMAGRHFKREHARLSSANGCNGLTFDDLQSELAHDPAPHHAILLGQLLSGLADDDREPLLLQVVEGFSTAQIAQRYGSAETPSRFACIASRKS